MGTPIAKGRITPPYNPNNQGFLPLLMFFYVSQNSQPSKIHCFFQLTETRRWKLHQWNPSWWFQVSTHEWKICEHQIGIMKPQGFGVKIKKHLKPPPNESWNSRLWTNFRPGFFFSPRKTQSKSPSKPETQNQRCQIPKLRLWRSVGPGARWEIDVPVTWNI